MRASTVPLLVCSKTSRSSSRKRDWSSFDGLLINPTVLHHERVLVIHWWLASKPRHSSQKGVGYPLYSLVRGDSGDLALAGL